MTMILTDSMAREHADTLRATAAASRRGRDNRLRLRAERRSERDYRRGGSEGDYRRGGSERDDRRQGTGRRRALRPLAAMRAWLVAGQL